MQRVCGNYYVASFKIRHKANQDARPLQRATHKGHKGKMQPLQKLMGSNGASSLADTANSEEHPLPSVPGYSRSVRFAELKAAWEFVRSGS